MNEMTRKGCTIKTFDDLLKEKSVYYCGFYAYVTSIISWKLERVLKALETGSFRYVFPADADRIRFSDEDVIHIEKRLGWERTVENRAEIIRLLHNYDRGYGDVDDTIDLYEDDPGY